MTAPGFESRFQNLCLSTLQEGPSFSFHNPAPLAPILQKVLQNHLLSNVSFSPGQLSTILLHSLNDNVNSQPLKKSPVILK